MWKRDDALTWLGRFFVEKKYKWRYNIIQRDLAFRR